MQFPNTAKDVSADFLTEIAAKRYAGTRIEQSQLVDVKDSDSFESSSSALVTMKVTYAEGNPHGLPENLLLKMSVSDYSLWYANSYAFFNNEINFYDKLRPELQIEAPASLGGAIQEDGRYVLALEDVRSRGAKFFTVLTEDMTIDHARGVLDTLARLHARYWGSPRFSTDLSWLETQIDGPVEAMMRKQSEEAISNELAIRKYKREALGMIDLTEDQLRIYSYAVKEHHSNLPQTVLHGDSHLGNMYFLTDFTAGLIDWQFMVRGYITHDLSYFLTVALPVEVRRREERNLLDFYREKLQEYGVVNGPDREALWLEYRRGMVWGFYPAWLTVPAENYGLEHAVVVHMRLVAAFLDHDSRKLLDEII